MRTYAFLQKKHECYLVLGMILDFSHRGFFCDEFVFAAEFIDGNSVNDFMKMLNRPLSAAEMLQIALPAAKGLAALHRQGILHRGKSVDFPKLSYRMNRICYFVQTSSHIIY